MMMTPTYLHQDGVLSKLGERKAPRELPGLAALRRNGLPSTRT